jgi:hypothetical protein
MVRRAFCVRIFRWDISRAGVSGRGSSARYLFPGYAAIAQHGMISSNFILFNHSDAVHTSRLSDQQLLLPHSGVYQVVIIAVGERRTTRVVKFGSREAKLS